MPNLKQLEAIGMTLAEYMALSDEDKQKAISKAVKVINYSHPPVTITHGSPRRNRGGESGGSE